MICTIVNTEEEKDLFGGKVTRDDVLNLVSYFRDNQYQMITEEFRSKYAYFTIAEIETFFFQMKMQSADGIRIYFAGVPPAYTHNNPDYENKMTVAFVATKVNEDGINDELLDNQSKVMFASHGFRRSPGYDFATLCPPDCTHKVSDNNDTSIADDVYRLNRP